MVIDRAIYLGKNNALDDIQFIMTIRTGQNVCLLLSVLLYVLLNHFIVDTKACFGPEAGLAFHCCCSALFMIRTWHVFYWFHYS